MISFEWNFKQNILNEKSALHIAVEKEKIDIVQLLLNCEQMNVNLIYVLNTMFTYSISISLFDKI